MLAVLILAASWKFRGPWIVSLILGSLCAAIAIGVTIKLYLTNMESYQMRVQICWACRAVWLAFAVLGLVHFLSIPMERNRAQGGSV